MAKASAIDPASLKAQRPSYKPQAKMRLRPKGDVPSKDFVPMNFRVPLDFLIEFQGVADNRDLHDGKKLPYVQLLKDCFKLYKKERGIEEE